MSLLRTGDEITNSDRSRRYRVDRLIGEGGFAEAYAADEIDSRGRPVGTVCVKALEKITTWHGEAYFGSLFRHQDRVVSLLDSFPHQVGVGMDTRMIFILVFELERQTVHQFFERGGTPWSAAGARRELLGLVGVLAEMHATGANHRDVKPDNVYVSSQRRLKLGDFGIAKHGPGGTVESTHISAEFVPDSLLYMRRDHWLPSDDLYQWGLLGMTILTGKLAATPVTAKDVRALGLDTRLEEALVRSIGPRKNRFENAAEAERFLTNKEIDVPVPVSLVDRRVVFTGKLPIPRREARTLLAQAGGAFREDVNGQTDVLVVGNPSPLYVKPRRGTKLFDAYRRIEKGEQIAIVGWDEFMRLVRRSDASQAATDVA